MIIKFIYFMWENIIERDFKTALTNIQLLSKIFLDSDFCHNYLHTPVGLT